MGRVEHHFFVTFGNFGFFAIFSRFFASFRVGTRSEGSDITEIFPKFKKSQFPKLAKTKISEKNRLSQGLSVCVFVCVCVCICAGVCACLWECMCVCVFM